MVPSARNVEITARPCSFAPSWAASSRVVMCSPFVPCLRLKGSSFWLTIHKGHDLIAVLTTGSLRSYCPVSDRSMGQLELSRRDRARDGCMAPTSTSVILLAPANATSQLRRIRRRRGVDDETVVSLQKG